MADVLETMTLTDDECDRILTAANDWEAYTILPHERIAVRAGFAAGLAAVPREPTQAMLRVDVLHGRCGHHLSGCALGDVWLAMWDASQAILKEPTQHDAPERMPAVISYEYRHDDGRGVFVGARIVADGWEADNPGWRRVGARYAPVFDDGRYCAVKHLPTLCSDCPALWCSGRFPLDAAQGEKP